MRKNYIVFKGLWWNWIPVLVRSFSLKSIKERVLFWLGGDSFAVFTNLVNNFKWGKRAKEVMNHAMFRYVMYDSFEGGGEFNFFFETFESFLLDNKNRQISFYSATRCSFIVLLVIWYVMRPFVSCLLYYFSPTAWVTATNINNTTEALNGCIFQSVLKRKKLKEKIDGKVVAVMASFTGHVFIVIVDMIWQ